MDDGSANAHPGLGRVDRLTYSMVARDSETGELGVAVQSRAFGCGAVCPWALPGVGAATTQSFTEISYGPGGLELLAAGRSPRETLDELVAGDDRQEFRQVAYVDAAGRAAAHTGAACVAECGHLVGENVSAQGNMLASSEVWPAMVETFERSSGPLAVRLLDALDAAEAAGGDFRGQQAGGLLVVSGNREDPPWARVVDVRVDDHSDPLRELRRLYELQRAYGRRHTLTPEEAETVGMRADEVSLIAAFRTGDVEGWIGDEPRRRDTIDRLRRLGYIP
jgi:uncharacterized Ntn-hydrolase superfamily protein